MKKIAIIDYGGGNLFSVEQALKRCGAEVTLVTSPEGWVKFDGIVLPGVGAFGQAITELRNKGLDQAIIRWVQNSKPFLGICLGMQLIMQYSEEFGRHEGLGLVEGGVHKFPDSVENQMLRIPQMGWNTIQFENHQKSLKGIPQGSDMYFVHSYFVRCANPADELTWTEYGGFRYTSALSKGSIAAFQFHPEKSAELGISIYENWIQQLS